MPTGFNLKKGFGFITPDDGSHPEVFAHHTAVQAEGFRYLNEGEKVRARLAARLRASPLAAAAAATASLSAHSFATAVAATSHALPSRLAAGQV